MSGSKQWYDTVTPPPPTAVTEAERLRAEAERHEAGRRQIEAFNRRQAEEAERLERVRREAGAARLADYEGRAHQNHLHNGGTEGDWPAVWRELKQQYLVEKTKGDAVDDVYARMTAGGVPRW